MFRKITNRNFKPGELDRDGLIQELDKSAAGGVVAVSINAPIPGGLMAMTSMPFNDLDAVEQDEDSFLADADRITQRRALDSKCLSVRTIVWKTIEPFENNTGITPKYVMRTTIKAKPGKAQEIISNLKEGRNSLAEGSNRFSISTPINGNPEFVRVTGLMESLSVVGETVDRITANENLYRSSELIQERFRGVSRIIHRKV